MLFIRTTFAALSRRSFHFHSISLPPKPKHFCFINLFTSQLFFPFEEQQRFSHGGIFFSSMLEVEIAFEFMKHVLITPSVHSLFYISILIKISNYAQQKRESRREKVFAKKKEFHFTNDQYLLGSVQVRNDFN